MKITHRFAALAAASFLAVAAAGAQGTDDYNLPQGFWFSNTVSSDTIKVIGNMHNDADHNDDGSSGKDTTENWMAEFGGLKEKIETGYNSEKFWFELGAEFGLKDNNQNFWDNTPFSYQYGINDTKQNSVYGENNTHRGLNADDLSFAWTDFWWGIRFTPFDIVDFYWNTDVWTPGSYLPLADEHEAGGNLGSDGVAVIVKPIDGLKLSAGIPFSFDWSSGANYLDAEREDWEDASTDDGRLGIEDSGNSSYSTDHDTDVFEQYWFRLNLGAEYTVADFLTVGGTITDVIHRQTRGYGLYANANLGNINANIGYTYNKAGLWTTVDDWDGLVVISGRHHINASGTVAFGDLTAGVEALFNLPVLGSYSIYDLYASLKVGYDLLPNKFNVGLRLYTAMDIRHDYASGHYSQAANKQFASLLYYSAGKYADAAEDGENIQSSTGAAPMIGITPSVTYRTGKHEFGAKAVLEYWLSGDGGYAASFPVYWKWNF